MFLAQNILRGSATFNWYIFDIFDIFQNCFFYSLSFSKYVCKFPGKSDFSSWKKKIKLKVTTVCE